MVQFILRQSLTVALAILPHNRSIDERAYLSQTALMFAINMANVITYEVIFPQKNPKNVDEIIQEVAHLVLSDSYYAKKPELVEKVIANAQIYYPSMEIEKLSVDKTIPSMKRITAWKKELVDQGEIFMLEACGWQVIPLSHWDIPPFIRLHPPLEEISCYSYAFMLAGVEEAFPPTWKEKDLLNLLPQWGFVPVSKENSKPGDLVVFSNESNLPDHMGIRYKDGILAKPGNAQAFAFVHKIEEAFPSYGKQVHFFRRALLT